MIRTIGLATLVTLAAGAAYAQERAQPPFMVDGSGRGFDRLSDAIAAIGDGQGTIVIAPGAYRQCAVQQGGRIEYRAASPGTAIFDGVTCEGKAALVLRGQSARIDGIVFQNLRVPDGNGAGIRLEHGDLDVVNSLFRNSEQGILTGEDEAGSIAIDRSTFQRLGRCDRDLDCAHSIYIGRYGRLSVTRSRFEAGNGGHYVKARAISVDIRDNSFDDSRGHLTNYMIDLPNGARGSIAGNEMVQGRDKDNYSAFIALAAEGGGNDMNGLSISGNSASFVPGLSRQSVFVADWDGGARLNIGQNRLAAGLTPYEKR